MPFLHELSLLVTMVLPGTIKNSLDIIYIDKELISSKLCGVLFP